MRILYLLPLTLFLFCCKLPAVDFYVGSPSTSTFHGVFGGFGAEWDPYFWNTRNQQLGCNQQGWDLITARIREMNIKIVRMWMQLVWCQSSRTLSAWSWTNANMVSVFKYLDFCQQNNIDVIMTDWAWSIGRLGFSGPSDPKYAEGLAYYLREFIVTRGYTCIKYFIVGNESDKELVPNWGLDAYINMYINVDQQLKNYGIRDKIKLIAPDSAYSLELNYTRQAITRLGSILDGYDIHRYPLDTELSTYGINSSTQSTWYHVDRWRDEILSRDPYGGGKPYFVTEFGIGNSIINTYDNALMMADYGTTLLTARVQGAIAWTMHDINYYDGIFSGDNFIMDWGLWKFNDAGWALRPWCQSYALLTKYAPPGSILSPVNDIPYPGKLPKLQPYRCGALQRPGGGWSVFLVNRSSADEVFNVHLSSLPVNPLQKYQVDGATFGNYPASITIPLEKWIAQSADISVNVPAASFVVLVESKTTDSPAITVNYDTLDFGVVYVNRSKGYNLRIKNVGGGVLTGTVTADKDWIVIDKPGFSGNDVVVNVVADNNILKEIDGQFSGSITVASNGGNVVIPFKMWASCVLVKPNPVRLSSPLVGEGGGEGCITFFGDGIVPGQTKIVIYTLSGTVVADLSAPDNVTAPINGQLQNEITWAPSNLSPGIYVYTYESPKERGVGKFTVIR